MKTIVEKLEHLTRYSREAAATAGVFVSIDLQPPGLRVRTTIEGKGEYHRCITFGAVEKCSVRELEGELDTSIQAAKDARPLRTSGGSGGGAYSAPYRQIVHSVEELVDAPGLAREPVDPTPNARRMLLECVARLNEIVRDPTDLAADAVDTHRSETRGVLLDMIEKADTLLEQLKGGLNGVQIWAEFDEMLYNAKLVADRTYRPGDRLRRMTAQETGDRLKEASK